MCGKEHGTGGDFPPNTSAFFFPIEDAPCLVTANLLPAKCYNNRLFLPHVPLYLW